MRNAECGSFFVDSLGRPSLSSPDLRPRIDKDCRLGRATRFSEFGTFLLCRRSWSTILVESHPRRRHRQRLSTRMSDQVLGSGQFLPCRQSWSAVLVESHPRRRHRQRLSTRTSDQVFWVWDVPSLSTILVDHPCRISPPAGRYRQRLSTRTSDQVSGFAKIFLFRQSWSAALGHA
jgi:hypothetical protein